MPSRGILGYAIEHTTPKEHFMARVTHVKAARKDQGDCGHCHKPIKAGTSYKHVSLRPSGPYSSLTLKRHENCPHWRPSELTFSKMRGVLAAQEEFADRLAAWDPADGVEVLNEALTECAEAVREVAQEYQESAQNMVDGFNGVETEKSIEVQEKGEALESWAEDIENAMGSVDDPPEAVEEPEDPGDDATDEEQDEFEEDTALYEEYEAELEEWADNVRDALSSEVDNCPV